MLLNTKKDATNRPNTLLDFGMEKTGKAVSYMIARMRNAKYGN